MDRIISINTNTAEDVERGVAQRVKARRLELNLTQEGLAARAGMKVPTFRKFERTGKISFHGLLQVAFALNALSDFEQLFATRQYGSIDELLNLKEKKRKRGKKNE